MNQAAINWRTALIAGLTAVLGFIGHSFIPTEVPIPEPVPVVVPLILTITDGLGKEVTTISPGTSFVVTASGGENKEWLNFVGSARLIEVHDGFVVFPTDTSPLVFSVRVGKLSAIKVLHTLSPKIEELESDLKSKSSRIDQLETDVDTLRDSLLVSATELKTFRQTVADLVSRITALEAPRPPPVPVPTPSTKQTLKIAIVEDKGNRSPAIVDAIEPILAWNQLFTAGHSYRWYDKGTPEADGKTALAALSGKIPGMVIYGESGQILYSGPLTANPKAIIAQYGKGL